MVYLTYGITKTASTYCYQMIRLLCISAGRDQVDLPDHFIQNNSNINFIDHLSSEKLDTLVQTYSDDSLIMIKTHSKAPENLKKYIEQGSVYACASYRDPRDIALSLIDAGKRTRSRGIEGGFNKYSSIEDTISDIIEQIDIFKEWIAYGALPVHYENLCFNTGSFLKSVCQQLTIPENLIKKILLESSSMLVGQYNKGTSLRHKNELSDYYNEIFINTFGEFISECEKISVKPSITYLARNKIYRIYTDGSTFSKKMVNLSLRILFKLFRHTPT